MPWPASLTWNSLAGYLDNFQTWLSDSRNVPDPSLFFVAFNGIATFLDDLVGWITSFFFKLTWVGTAALGTLVVLRYGGRRAALGVVAAFAVVRADRALGVERADVLAHDRVGQPGACDRAPARRARRALRPLPELHHPRARRDADRPGLCVPDADRDPLLGRPWCSRRGDADLRDPARDPHHRTRDPRRPDEHGRSGGSDGLDAASDAHEGADSDGAADAAALREPDDPLRAVDGRDRRADRRAGPRRRRDERPLLEPGARTRRRRRDRGHGDRARPLHRGDGEPHRPDSPPSDGREAPATAPLHPRLRRRRRARRRARLSLRRRQLLDAPDHRGLAARPRAERPRLHPEPVDVHLPHHEPDRELPRAVLPHAAEQLLRRDAVAGDGVRPRAGSHTSSPAAGLR